MVDCGMGAAAFDLVERSVLIRKAATSTGNRPSIEEHYNSMRFSPKTIPVNYNRIIIVDDVITQGHTSLAVRQILTENLPECEIMFFTAFRTVQEFKKGFLPKESNIVLYDKGTSYVDHN